MAYVHTSVNEMSRSYLSNERRYNYTTPKSYLEQIKLYQNLLHKKGKELTAKMERLQNGLQKLSSTSAQVREILFLDSIMFLRCAYCSVSEYYTWKVHPALQDEWQTSWCICPFFMSLFYQRVCPVGMGELFIGIWKIGRLMGYLKRICLCLEGGQWVSWNGDSLILEGNAVTDGFNFFLFLFL